MIDPNLLGNKAAPGSRWTPWVRRYLAQDLFGLAGALLAGHLALALFGGLVALSLGAVVGENLGFYGAAWVRELRIARARAARTGAARAAPRGAAWLATKRLAREFALAELLDSTLVRPLAVVGMAAICASPTLCITVGGLAADCVFYGIAARCAPSHRG